MNVFNTEMHLGTFLCVILEIFLLSHQLAFYLQKPSDIKRKYFLVLLFLLITYNICRGIFTDEKIPIAVEVQNIISYGSAFCMACYFPYYFYKAFNITELVFHAKYGVLLFLLFPFFVFFCVLYPIEGDLQSTVYVGLLIPVAYAVYMVYNILLAIRKKYKSIKASLDVFLSYGAVFPWALMPLMGYFDVSQLTEVVFTNGGFLVITILYLGNMIEENKKDLQTISLIQTKNEQEIFLTHCSRLGLTKREIEICELVSAGKIYKEIADNLCISERTVNKHMQNIFKKSESKNKVELLNRIKR